jgi:hypothetical protein
VRFAANVLPIIREVQAAEHTSANGIARRLNARKVATAVSGGWTHVQVRQIINGHAAGKWLGFAPRRHPQRYHLPSNWRASWLAAGRRPNRSSSLGILDAIRHIIAGVGLEADIRVLLSMLRRTPTEFEQAPCAAPNIAARLHLLRKATVPLEFENARRKV